MTTRQALLRILNAKKLRSISDWGEIPYLNHQIMLLPINKVKEISDAVEVDFVKFVYKLIKIYGKR